MAMRSMRLRRPAQARPAMVRGKNLFFGDNKLGPPVLEGDGNCWEIDVVVGAVIVEVELGVGRPEMSRERGVTDADDAEALVAEGAAVVLAGTEDAEAVATLLPLATEVPVLAALEAALGVAEAAAASILAGIAFPAFPNPPNTGAGSSPSSPDKGVRASGCAAFTFCLFLGRG